MFFDKHGNAFFQPFIMRRQEKTIDRAANSFCLAQKQDSCSHLNQLNDRRQVNAEDVKERIPEGLGFCVFRHLVQKDRARDLISFQLSGGMRGLLLQKRQSSYAGDDL
jgi:hypothetical protein